MFLAFLPNWEWDVVGWTGLSIFGLSTIIFLSVNLRNRVITAPLKDPLSGRPSWPRPDRRLPLWASKYPWLLRGLFVAAMAAGAKYILWRWSVVAWDYWFISVPLVLAETIAYLDIWLTFFALWNVPHRGEAPPPPEEASVDVFITCYNEPLDIVRGTVRAAKQLRYPHKTYVLDDGNNPAVRAMAKEEGVYYLTRTEDWKGKPRHAKAGNIANAMALTDGDFILIQDADQMPYPELLDETLGYFTDPEVAVVQTPHWFYNVPPTDPLGAQQPLFYGPVLIGRDALNAAFFCGSNGIIRREALLAGGILRFVDSVEARAVAALKRVTRAVARTDFEEVGLAEFGDEMRDALKEAEELRKAGVSLQEWTWNFRRRHSKASRKLVRRDVEEMQELLSQLEELADAPVAPGDHSVEQVTDQLVDQNLSPPAVMDVVPEAVEGLDVSRPEEALPVLPFYTRSITEDMATSMDLHAMGWKTVYHDQILARGLGPDDLKSSLSQRLRWAQGTYQLALQRNPLKMKGLTLPQKLMYFHSMWSYLSGFSVPLFIISPVVYIFLDWPALRTYGFELVENFVPYLVFAQLAFLVWTKNLKVWRSVQYSITFFPLWIKAAFTSVWEHLGFKKLTFVVTPKEAESGRFWHLTTWQLVALLASGAAVIQGLLRLGLEIDPDPAATAVNVAWAWFNSVLLSVTIPAVMYRAPVAPSKGTD